VTARIDETGNVYGSLTVVGLAGPRPDGKARWLCRCECGGATEVLAASLRAGRSQSCGCGKLQNARKYDREETTWRFLYAGHTRRKDKHGCLPFDEWKAQVQRPCHYCGDEPPERHPRPSGDPVRAHGVDRIDSTRGYSADNVVTCCEQCNKAKNAWSADEFVAMCRKVAERHPAPLRLVVG
jgi:hypothetical protein